MEDIMCQLADEYFHARKEAQRALQGLGVHTRKRTRAHGGQGSDNDIPVPVKVCTVAWGRTDDLSAHIAIDAHTVRTRRAAIGVLLPRAHPDDVDALKTASEALLRAQGLLAVLDELANAFCVAATSEDGAPFSVDARFSVDADSYEPGGHSDVSFGAGEPDVTVDVGASGALHGPSKEQRSGLLDDANDVTLGHTLGQEDVLDERDAQGRQLLAVSPGQSDAPTTPSAATSVQPLASVAVLGRTDSVAVLENTDSVAVLDITKLTDTDLARAVTRALATYELCRCASAMRAVAACLEEALTRTERGHLRRARGREKQDIPRQGSVLCHSDESDESDESGLNMSDLGVSHIDVDVAVSWRSPPTEAALDAVGLMASVWAATRGVSTSDAFGVQAFRVHELNRLRHAPWGALCSPGWPCTCAAA